ncbi:MAG: LamG-like jellyroll fold domain-containing protein [Bacteroidota bacterium]
MKNFYSLGLSLIVGLFANITIVNAQAPTVPACCISTAGTSTSYISINWGPGNGSRRIVTCAPFGSAISYPSNGNAYAASSTYGSGSFMGNSTYCVYNGTSTGTTIFGLTANTRYTVRIFEYNIFFSSEYYLGSHPAYSEYTLAVQPTVQVSNLISSNITASSASLSLTAGNGTNNLIALRSATAYANPPVDGTDYFGSTVFGNGDYITGTSPYPYVMYDLTGTSISASGLAAGTTYTAAAFSYNGFSGANNYYTSSYPVKTFTTLAAEPTTASNTVAFSNITDNSMMVSWTTPSSGGGVYRIVTCKPGTSNNDLPTDATYYAPSSTYGFGNMVGSAYVIYNGYGNHVTVTGLSNTTTYAFSVFEYNVSTNTYNNTYNYRTLSYATGYQQTLATEPTVPSSNLVFSNITSNSVRATWANGNGGRRNVGVRAGRLQTALAFNGTTDYISVSNESNFDFTNSMTVEAWFKINSPGAANQTIASKGDNSWRLCRNGSTNVMHFAITIGGSPYYVNGNRNVIDGKWHHVAGVYTGSQLQIYIDGTLDAYLATSGTCDNSTYPVYIGDNAQISGRKFIGQIDEVRVWNIAQSAFTIKNNMHKTLVGNEYGLKGYWKLDEGFANSTTAKNSSFISGIDGTLVGFSSTAAATSFTATSGWALSGAKVNVPLDFTSYSDNPAFMSSNNSGYYYGGANTYVVYKGPDSTSITVTGLSPATYYNFAVIDFTGITGNNNYLTDAYATADVLTSSVSVPTITSFTPSNGSIGTIVTINGTGFNPTAANNTVFFGATKALVLSATAVQLTVQVPLGATFEPISVTNNNLTGCSVKPFVVTSSCSGSNFTATSLNAATSFSAYFYPSEQTFADIDLDGRPDLVAAHIYSYMSVNRNTVTASGGPITFGPPSGYYHPYSSNYSDLAVADFDGDGKVDVALNNYYNSAASIVVYRNTSSVAAVSFASLLEFPGNTSVMITDIAATDLDKDGKPDIIVSYANNTVSYYRNISSTGNINFSSKTDILIGGTSVINTIATGDLDGDGKTDVALACGTGNNITYLRNTSSPGSISFAPYTSTTVSAATEGLAIGDIDTDGKMDLVTGSGTTNIAVIKNNSISGTISMLSPSYVSTTLSITVTDVSLSDIDGDNKADIAVGYTSGSQVSLFKNNSTASIIIAAPNHFTLAASQVNPSNISVGDLNGDSKPDLLTNCSTYAHSIFQNNINALAGEPIAASSAINFTAVSTSSITVNWTAGNGANRIVVARAATTSAIVPNDAVGYVPNTVFGSGTNIGGGNYVVFDGNGNSVTVTGLQSNTAYTFTVYEYNGTQPCQYNYLIGGSSSSGTQATNNIPPTLAAISDPASVCQDASEQTVNISGITSGSGSEVQTLSITAKSGNTGLIPDPIVTYTSPNTTGTLKYTPVAGIAGTAVITVTVNDGAANNASTVQTFTVTIDHTPTVAVAGANQQICPGVATMSANTPVYGTGTWVVNYTSNGAITVNNPLSPTTTVDNFLVGDSVRLRWVISNGACPASGNFVTVKRKACPTTADFTASSNEECLNGTPSVTFTDASIGSGATINSWSWNFGAGASPATANTQGPHTVLYTTAGPKHISLTVTDNLAANDNETKFSFVNIIDIPEPADNVSGSVTVCQGQNGVVYSTPVIVGATGYTWTLPSGAILISGINTNNITVDFGSGAISGNIRVRGTNACGNGTLSSAFPVTVNPLPSAAGTISGVASVCEGVTSITYSVSPVANADAAGYVWTVPVGATITSATNTNSITVNYAMGAQSGDVTVKGTNSCGSGITSAKAITVNPYPDAADIIAGQALITTCPTTIGINYSIPLVTNATSYNWTVPSGATITAGAGTNQITVTYGAGAVSGDITITPVNTCGNGIASTLSITVNTLPDIAGNISGNDTLTVCPASNGVVYTVSPIFNADDYIWSLPTGATIVNGDSTNSITVNFDNTAVSGNISVYGKNACGNGLSSTIFVEILTIPTQSLCMVTVDNNSNYNRIYWEKPALTDVDSFRIYREITTSFVHIASVHYDSLSEYVDSVYLPAADPNTTNFRYKISIVDTCGNESVLSTHHRTLFLQANQGVGGVINLNWVAYEGATVTMYRILRDSTGTGVFEAIDSVPAANTLYTDNNPPLTANVSYLLESIWATACTPTRGTIVTTRSNIKSVAAISTVLKDKEILNREIQIYPNPATEMITVQYPAGFKMYQLQVFDALGQLVYNEELSADGVSNGVIIKQMDVRTFRKGIYFINMQTEYGSAFKRIVIQ